MSHIVGEAGGVQVGTFAAGAGKGQRVQLSMPAGRDYATLMPTDAIALANQLARAAASAGGFEQEPHRTVQGWQIDRDGDVVRFVYAMPGGAPDTLSLDDAAEIGAALVSAAIYK